MARQPIYPNPPVVSAEAVVAHNLACISEQLNTLTEILERVSSHLYDLKKQR